LSQDLIDPILDWQDSDFNNRFPNGAEDDFYLSTEVPYRAANRPMQSISELRLVKGIDAKTWKVLAPYVCVLPDKTTLNINTAGAVLMQALDPNFSLQDGEQLVAARPDSGYTDVNKFVEDNQAKFSGPQVDQALLGVASQHFLVRSEITLGTARAQVFSIVQRNNNGSLVLARTQGTW
jgi:general secretion pathway protein K